MATAYEHCRKNILQVRPHRSLVNDGLRRSRWFGSASVVEKCCSGYLRPFIFVLIPEMMVWGCGALIARELGAGGSRSTSILTPGRAFYRGGIHHSADVAGTASVGGCSCCTRAWGVNWIEFYLCWGTRVCGCAGAGAACRIHFSQSAQAAVAEKGWGLFISQLCFCGGLFIAEKWFCGRRLRGQRRLNGPNISRHLF